MKRQLRKLWHETDGVLAFEWTMLLTLLVIGIVSGVAAARDAIIDELGDTAQVMLAVDQSYTIDFPLDALVHSVDPTSSSDSSFTDAASYTDCARTDFGFGLNPLPGPLVGQNQDSGNPGFPITILDGPFQGP